MSPAGNLSEEISGKFSDNSFVSTYIGGGVALKCGAVDHHSAARNINTSALEVACPPPGIGANLRQFFRQKILG